MGDIEHAVNTVCGKDAAQNAWVVAGVANGKLFLKGTGTGVESLKDALPDDDCAYCLLSLRVDLQGVPDQQRNIWMQWKGPDCSGMKKVKANQLYQEALSILAPNHGQLEVIGKTQFNEATITTKWQPSAGSHVID